MIKPTDMLFEVNTPLHFKVRATRSRWELIVTIKHPIMAGLEIIVQETIENPETIRQSHGYPDVYLFYKSTKPKRWICAVVKRLNDEGFLITAYLTDAIKEGVIIWPK